MEGFLEAEKIFSLLSGNGTTGDGARLCAPFIGQGRTPSKPCAPVIPAQA